MASLQNTRSSGAPIYGAVAAEEEYFGGVGGGDGIGNNGGGNDFPSPSSSRSYFPADSNAGVALDPSRQYAGSSSRSTAAVAAANAADADSPIIISRLTGEVEFLSFF